MSLDSNNAAEESTQGFLNKAVIKLIRDNIRFILVGIDFFLIALSWWIACTLTLGNLSLKDFFVFALYTLPILYTLKVLIFTVFGLYRAILRYASFHFAITIVKAVLVSCIAYPAIYFLSSHHLPLGLFPIDMIMTMAIVGFTRFLPRYYSESAPVSKRDSRRVIIYGAGEVGDSVARSLLRLKNEFYPIGFIDDDPKKIGRKVHNLPVLGKRPDLPKILQRHRINELIVAISNYPAEELREVVKMCRSQHVFCRLVPAMPGTADQEISIKNIDIADLLKRNPQDLDEKQIDRFLRGKKILVTGAAGSIGSELIRQCLRFHPKRVVMLDNSEFGLYKLGEDLSEQVINQSNSPYTIRFVLQDLCDTNSINHLVKEEKPDIIFHAAAFKHVPLLESNPFAGVINNIQGTINIANAADANGIEKFVLISTDKAVRPTNVMGATKRVCELYIQNLNLRSNTTEYVGVRFGNVLGSSGSVIPKFLEQIRQGGPITVTHPEVVRYFMLIQEAVELAMQAASIGHGGEIFILNMGKPVKIKEMAENLIFLAGKEPYRDVDIRFTGLRPGEKLYEELLIDETEKKTQYENITIGKMTFIDWQELNTAIIDLLSSARSYRRQELITNLRRIVPEFTHYDLPANEEKVIPIHSNLKA